MRKEFVTADLVRDNGIKLAQQILDSGFVPDVIYVSLRGGACLGNVLSKYFQLAAPTRPILYAAVAAHSYTNVGTAAQIKIEGWTLPPENLRATDKVLLVDDTFDSGETINALGKIILDAGITRENLKVAVHDYKFFTDRCPQLPIQPDYWCRKHDLRANDESYWIHYLSHELAGLSPQEVRENYPVDTDQQLRAALRAIGL